MAEPGTGGGGATGQWALALLPAFPLILLVGRLWHLSRQDLPTMLLLVQRVSPLGLISALIITLAWVPPALVLVGRALGALQVVSTPPGAGPTRSWLTRRASRIPDWVVAVSALWAALMWELRFLPALVALLLAIAGLTVRQRWPGSGARITAACVVVPLLVAAGWYLVLTPAIADALGRGEVVTALLLGVPPALGPLLTGPLPGRGARAVTHWPASAAALLLPFVLGGIFLGAPVLPTAAVELRAADGSVEVVEGNVVDVDEGSTALLVDNRVRFVPNTSVLSQTLCPESDDLPHSDVLVHGWHVELSAAQWVLPTAPAVPLDPRCEGRPLA